MSIQAVHLFICNNLGGTMTGLNGYGKTRKTEEYRRRYEDCFLEGDSRSMGASPLSCSEYGDVEIAADRAAGERPTSGQSIIARRDSIVGGILRQLISQARNQAARLEDQIQELNGQANEWEKLLSLLEESPPTPIESEN